MQNPSTHFPGYYFITVPVLWNCSCSCLFSVKDHQIWLKNRSGQCELCECVHACLNVCMTLESQIKTHCHSVVKGQTNLCLSLI